MKKTILLAVSLILVLAVAGIAYTRLGSRVAPPTTPTDNASGAVEAAPDFTFFDAEGQSYRLSDFRGKPVVLNFWASWCAPCKQEMPDFQTAYEEFGDEVQFLMLNLTGNGSDTTRAAQSAIEKGKYTFPVYYDLDADGAAAYDVRSIPTTILIDENGGLLQRRVGMMSLAELRSFCS